MKTNDTEKNNWLLMILFCSSLLVIETVSTYSRIALSLFQSMRAFFRSFTLESARVSSFNFLVVLKPKSLLCLCHISRSFPFFSVLSLCVIGPIPPCFFLLLWEQHTLFLLSPLFPYFLLSIHPTTSSESMPYPAVRCVKCLMLIGERTSLLSLSFFVCHACTLTLTHHYLIKSKSTKSSLTQYLTHVYTNIFQYR